MGFFDPVWTAVDGVVAGAGAAVAGGISGLGEGISSAGKSAGDSVAGMANGYADYVHNSANYVRDATGAEGVRKGTAANPLGLTSDKASARSYGAAKNLPPAQQKALQQRKEIDKKTAGAAKGTAAQSAQKNTAANTGAKRVPPASAAGAKKSLPAPKPAAAAPKKPAAGGKKPGSTGGSVTGTSAGISPARKIQLQKAQAAKKKAGGK